MSDSNNSGAEKIPHNNSRPRAGSGKWFLLATGFLIVNTWGIWKMTHRDAASQSPATVRITSFSPGANAAMRDADPLVWKFSGAMETNRIGAIQPDAPGHFAWRSPTELAFEPSAPWRPCNLFRATLDEKLCGAAGERLEGTREFAIKTEPLKLEKMEQVNITESREVTLRLVFNASPMRDQFQKFLTLSEEGDPELSYELVGRAGSNVVLIKTESLSHDSFNLVLHAGLPAREGPAGLQEDCKRTITAISGFQFQRIEAASPAFSSCELNAIFSALPDANELPSHISIAPAAKFTAEPLESWRGGGFKMTGDFKPGAVYTITIKAGLKSASGVALAKDIVRQVQFPNRPKSVTFATSGRYLSPRGKLAVPVSAMNQSSYEIAIAPVFQNNLVQLALRESGRLSMYGAGHTEKLIGHAMVQTNLVAPKMNEEVKSYVDLKSLAGPEPRGLYLLTLGGSDNQLIAITDIGIAARVAKDGVLVWANSLRDAKPVGAAEITLLAENNQELARGTTADDGTVFLKCRTDDVEALPFVVIAKKNDDLSYIDLGRTKVDFSGAISGRDYVEPGKCEAFVFTERGVYRPGETAHMKAIVRDDKLTAPKSFPALFRIRKPDGRVFKDLPVTLDEYGAAEASLALPEYLPTGRYTFEFALPGTFTVIGETVVSLEDFVPPQIRVNLTSPQSRLAGGAEVKFETKAEHLFGRAASGLKAGGFMTFKSAPFAPKSWPDWKFGDAEKPFAPVYRQLGNKLLDDDGKAEFTAESSGDWRPPAAIQVAQSATVFESSGRSVTAYGSSFLDVYPFYIGIKSGGEGTIRAGETQRVAIVAVTPDGVGAKEQKVLIAKLARVQWNSVLRRQGNGRYEWKSERSVTIVREDKIAAGGQPKDFAFVAESTGEYLLSFADADCGASSSIRFNAAAKDQEWVEWSREKPDSIELTLDREKYSPGETAKLFVKAPFSGQALLTIESDQVLDHRLVTLEKNSAEISVDVKPEFSPNVYCSLTLIRPAVAESVWSAHRASGSAAMKVEPPGRRLRVAINAPATNRPQSKLATKITVTDESGKPVAGDATVMAVDEAICMLTSFETPQPMDWFFAQRRLGISLFDLYSQLMPVMDDELTASSHIGGDDGAALRKRLNPIKSRRFKPVALWQSGVHLDANGQAEVNFDLPEFAGELRLMAVACNAIQAGAGDSSVKVKRPLVVEPSLPRFLAPGDLSDATVQLFNESGAEISATVRVVCTGPLTAEKPELVVKLESGATQTVRMPLRAGAVPGNAVCKIEVTGGDEPYRESIELPVRPASALNIAAEFGVIEAGQKKEIIPPAGWIPESVVTDIRVSSQPALRLSRALDYVMHYPYGCLEQTVSSSFPLLYAADIANRILPQSSAKDDVAVFVQAGILRALSMQQGDGSFSLWPRENRTYEAGSIYATHFLVEANKAAYNVPADRLDAAMKWLRERLDRSVITDANSENSAWQDDMQARAYACHVLALAGKPDHGWNARLREESARLRFAARVHTACALMIAGEPRQATEILGQLGMPADKPREIGGLLNSGVRDASLLLSAWLDIDPKNDAVERLAQFIHHKQRDGHWQTTQDDAMALLALGKYSQRIPADARPFSGLLSTPRGLSRALTSTQEVHWVSGSDAGRDARVTLVNDGPGKMYFSARIEGVAEDGQIAELDNGIAIRREVFDMNGAPLDASSLEQGTLAVVKLTLDTQGRDLDNIAIEELVPAGWEIENPALATSQKPDWIQEKSDWCIHRDIRDDRLVLFTGGVTGKQSFYYAARAVTPGKYVLPAATAACMYDPEIRSVNGRMMIQVKP